jgi:hypothetical protein
VTVWTCNLLLKHHAAGDMRARLWGDDDTELLMVLYGIGAGIEDSQRDTSWENYLITLEQQVLAVDQFGVIVTDYLEPRLQRAMREGDLPMVMAIYRSRENFKGKPSPVLRDLLAVRALNEVLRC